MDCTETKTESKPASEHNDHEKDTENCSPFCICACCGSTIVSNFLFNSIISDKKQIFLSEKEKINFYTTSSISDFCGNIWQPPKISW